MQENHRILKKNMKKWKTRTLTKHCIYCAKLMFSLFSIRKSNEKWEPKSEVFWGPEATFGLQKGGQNDDFFETWQSEFRMVKTMVCGTLGSQKRSKIVQQNQWKSSRTKAAFVSDFLAPKWAPMRFRYQKCRGRVRRVARILVLYSETFLCNQLQ